ncbi:MAG: DUF4286 family protein [Dehalococcoidia bacterium]
MTKTIVLVFTNCADPAREEEFNQWYNNTHVPDVLEVPGFVACTRYEVIGNLGPGQGKFLAVYEVESDDIPSSMATLQQRVGELVGRGRIIDCLRLVSATPCREISERQTA